MGWPPGRDMASGRGRCATDAASVHALRMGPSVSVAAHVVEWDLDKSRLAHEVEVVETDARLMVHDADEPVVFIQAQFRRGAGEPSRSEASHGPGRTWPSTEHSKGAG